MRTLKKLIGQPLLSFYLSCLLCLLVCTPAQLRAQLLPGTTPDSTEAQLPEWPEDSLGRRTPRGTVYGFISAVADQDYTKAAYYLNLSPAALDMEEGEQLAQALQRLLDQGGDIMPYSWISDKPSGRMSDKLPPSIDRIGTVSVNGQTIVLLVEEIKGPEGGPLWLFSTETLEEVAEVAGDINELLTDRLLPPFLKVNRWGGVPIGHWLIELVLIGLSYLCAWGITAFIVFLIRGLWRKAATEPTSGIILALALPIRLYMAVWLFVASSQEVGISIIIRQRFNDFTVLIGMVAFLLLLWRLSDFLGNFSKNRLMMRGHLAGVSAILFFRRLVKIAIVIFGVIAILGAFGVDVTTGLAALGIGGIALALGAQKSVENFVGSVTLIADQPIRVGDFCKIGDTIGTVEQIGMRSTRIRTLDRTVVTIPNGELSSSKIENYAHRDRFRMYAVLNMRYETSPDQLRYLLVEIRAILYAHPKVDPDPARVRFVELAAASLNIEIFAYIHAKDFHEYLEIKEDLYLRIMDVVEASGSGFAFPSQTLYLARDKGLSEEKTEEAERKVKSWREKGEMHIPSFDQGEITHLKDTLDYPPKGSSQRKNS